MRTLFTRLYQPLSRSLATLRLSNTPLAWASIVLLVAAFLFPYAIFPSLFDTFQSYGSAALVPLCVSAYLQGYRGALITWGMIVIGMALLLWFTIGLSWQPSVINNYVSGNVVGLLVGLVAARFLQMHRQIVAARLAAQAQEQRLAQQQELNELKDQLILNLSHELRTPLTAVQGYLDLLGDYYQQLDEATRAAFLSYARNGCLELGELISNLLDVMDLEQKRVVTPFESIPVAQLVRALLDQWGSQMRQDHEIVLEIPEELAVQASPQHLRQVLRYLLSNAIKYSPPHSTILIRAMLSETDRQGKAGAPHVCICVKDEGVGIPPDEIPLLFNKFVRLKRDLASNLRGTGLGLYISKQLVEAMHGRIWAESSGKAGEGSYFYLLLSSASLSPGLNGDSKQKICSQEQAIVE